MVLTENGSGKMKTRKKQILVVDDEPEMAELLRSGLVQEGFQVDTVATGRDALARLRQDRPDAVFLDLGLPDMSGFEVPGPTSGTRYFPAFDSDLARRSFGLHLMLILRIIEQMSIDYSERYTEEDRFSERDSEALNLAILLMRAEGMVELDD